MEHIFRRITGFGQLKSKYYLVQLSAGINDRARYRAPLSPEEASVLLAVAYSLRAWRQYDHWVQDHRDAEHTLKTSGLLHSDRGPHHADVHADVRYSLDRDTNG